MTVIQPNSEADLRTGERPSFRGYKGEASFPMGGTRAVGEGLGGAQWASGATPLEQRRRGATFESCGLRGEWCRFRSGENVPMHGTNSERNHLRGCERHL